jgi:GntR family transcriptional regulator of vanillate catabolism
MAGRGLRAGRPARALRAQSRLRSNRPPRGFRVPMTQQTTTTLQLREMILRGELAPGERLREAELAARLGTSRTPVRQALPALAQEGLLVRAGQRGFAVRAFSPGESLEALRLRAVLEGFAARQLAERRAPTPVLDALHDCLREGDALFTGRTVHEADEVRYAEMNARFHGIVLEGSAMPLLAGLAARCNLVPFTAPDRIAFSSADRRTIFDLLFHAHRQHHSIVEAIAAGHGDRAEFLFREHAIRQEHSMRLNGPSSGGPD